MSGKKEKLKYRKRLNKVDAEKDYDLRLVIFFITLIVLISAILLGNYLGSPLGFFDSETSYVHAETTPPGAFIFLDQQDSNLKGKTPLTFSVSPGTHLITFVKPGYVRWSTNLYVEAGSMIRVEADLRPKPAH